MARKRSPETTIRQMRGVLRNARMVLAYVERPETRPPYCDDNTLRDLAHDVLRQVNDLLRPAARRRHG